MATFGTLQALIQTLVRDGNTATPVHIPGPPGIGKTAVPRAAAQALATEMGRTFVEVQAGVPFTGDIDDVFLFCNRDLTSEAPEDLGGLPRTLDMSICGEPMIVTQKAVPLWAAPFCHPRAVGVLVLDDINAASPAIHAAARQTALFKRIGDGAIARGVQICLTGNRREDKAGARPLPSHFNNSIMQIALQVNTQEWCAWLGQQPGIDPTVGSYIQFRPGKLTQTPADADDLGAFGTPRSWAKLATLLPTLAGLGDAVLMAAAAGLVGQGPAYEYRAFVKIRSQLVPPGALLDVGDQPVATLQGVLDPVTLDSPDKVHAFISGLAEEAAKRSNEAGSLAAQNAVARSFLRSLAHASAGNREFMSSALMTFQHNAREGRMSTIISCIHSTGNSNDPLIQAVIHFFNNC